IQLEECVKKEICDVGQQQSSRHGVGLRGRKGDQRDGKTATEVGRRLTGENIGDIVIRLEEGKTGNRAKGVLGTSYEDPVRMQTEQILNEHIYTLGEKPISKYFQEYNILGQKSLGIKKSILQHEIFVEQKKSVDTISLEAMKKGQEKSAEGISVVEVPSERQNMEKKPIVSENDRHETTISERVCIEQPGLKDMKEAGLKPLEVVLESIVSVKHGQDAKKIQYEMQYETLDIHPDLIISEITKQGDLKQNGIGIEGNFESGETSEDEFLRLVEKVDIVSTSVITVPAALGTTETASAYEYVMEKHQQSSTDAELEDRIFSVKKATTTYGTESEIPANGLEVEVKKLRMFEDIPDKRILEEYGAIISKAPTTEEKHTIDMKSPAELGVVDQLNKIKSFENIIPDGEILEEY
ncbi:hypothetical protein WUBG_16614, partial [Wuchereria bancrofti]